MSKMCLNESEGFGDHDKVSNMYVANQRGTGGYHM